MNTIDFKKSIENSYQKIRPYVLQTPLIRSEYLSQTLDADVYLKLENIQHTSSFKVRGAFNTLLGLSSEECQKGIVAASSGNHGAAVAYACKTLGISATIFVPESTVISKLNNIRLYHPIINTVGHECGDTERRAREYATQNGQVFISPYNDLNIIFGQGTLAKEILDVKSDIDAIYASVGGGGLISGIGAYTKTTHPDIQVVGCLPRNSPVMYESIKAGKIVDLVNEPSLSDGTAGNIEKNAITFELCQQYVDDYILVSEEEIQHSIRLLLFNEHLLVEGAAAVTLASLINNKNKIKNKKIVLVLCGANISEDQLKRIIV